MSKKKSKQKIKRYSKKRSVHCKNEVMAMSYNISFASQLNKEIGSEADFVAECNRRSRNCYEEAVKRIHSLCGEYKIDVLGIQEAQDAELATKIMEGVPMMNSYFRPGVWNSDAKTYVGALLLWNSERLGNSVKEVTVNLATKESGDGRPCGIVVTDKGYVLVVAHFPWLTTMSDLTMI
jgi:hypothetical protein